MSLDEELFAFTLEERLGGRPELASYVRKGREKHRHCIDRRLVLEAMPLAG